MLEAFITARAKRRILALFLMDPVKERYFREICRLTCEQTNVARRELRMLERAGLLVSRIHGNRRYYAVNKRFPFLGELKSIIIKTEGVGGMLGKELEKIKGVDFAFIYGSTALGEERRASDIDVFIIGKAPVGKVNEAVFKAQGRVSREINYVIYPPAEFLRKLPSGFIREVVKSKKIMIVGGEDEFKRFVERGKNKARGA